jgi:hypothetical protein
VVSEFPNILVFRLEPVGLLRNRATNVQHPSRLLAKDLCAYATNAETATKSYTLSGVIYFEGQVFADADGAGHFCAACLSQGGKTWRLYNDDTVKTIGELRAENACMPPYAQNSSHVSAKAFGVLTSMRHCEELEHRAQATVATNNALNTVLLQVEMSVRKESEPTEPGHQPQPTPNRGTPHALPVQRRA